MSFDILLRRSRVGFFPATATRRARRGTVSLAFAVVCCLASSGGAHAAHVVTWGRIGTVTTLTQGQLCTNDGWNISCNSTTPTIASGLVGIGSTAPVVSLDLSQKTDALALPVGTSGMRPTGVNLANGEIRYNSTLSGVETYVNGTWDTVLTAASIGSSLPAAGSNGQVQFNNAGDLGASANFFWDNTNGRVGIGTTSPNYLTEFQKTDTNTTLTGNLSAEISVTNPAAVQAGPAAGIRFVAPVSSIAGGEPAARILGAFGGNGFNLSQLIFQTVTGVDTFTSVGAFFGSNFGAGTLIPADPEEVQGAIAPSTVGTQGVLMLSRGVNNGVSWPNVAEFDVGRYQVGSTSPNTRLDIDLKTTSNSTHSGDTNVMTLLSNGNVGIGTTSPGYMLHINGTSPSTFHIGSPTVAGGSFIDAIAPASGGLPGAELTLSRINADWNTPATLNFNSGGSTAWAMGLLSSVSFGGSFAIGTSQNDASPAFLINSSKNVGIGTTSPDQALTINGNLDFPYGANRTISVVNTSGTGAGYNLSISAGSSTSGSGGAGNGGTLNLNAGASPSAGGSGAAGAVNITGGTSTGSNGSGTGGFVNITGGSNASIGAPAPAGNVVITGGATSGGASSAGSVTITGGNASAANSFGGNVTINAGTGPSGNGNIILGNTTGSVGIGTTTPGAKLQVNGGAAIGYSTSTAAPSNGLAVNGTVGVGTTTTPTGVTATVNGVVQVAGTGSEPCTAAQVGSMRYNPTGQYMEICTYP